jgi:hypothetical protein
MLSKRVWGFVRTPRPFCVCGALRVRLGPDFHPSIPDSFDPAVSGRAEKLERETPGGSSSRISPRKNDPTRTLCFHPAISTPRGRHRPKATSRLDCELRTKSATYDVDLKAAQPSPERYG